MKKFMWDFRVSSLSWLSGKHFLLKLVADLELPDINPGQFVEILVENSPKTFLRRPVSIHFVDKNKKELWLLIQVVGKGTQKLSELKTNEIVNMIFPLGNGFSLPLTPCNTLLVGGGVGIAPLLYLAAKLKQNHCDVTVLIGAKTKADLLQVTEFEKYGKLCFTTEDGSIGNTGLVTQHPVLQKQYFDRIFVCGPTPMMKAVSEFALRNNIPCEVSLENKMACGIGACLCCVTQTSDGHRCVCSDGPVFNSIDLTWQN